MKTCSEEEGIFTPEDIRNLEEATKFVTALVPPLGKTIRCHELARAVGHVLKLPHCDGRYGMGIEHTWLRIGDWAVHPGAAKILDVYVPGRVPQVQLIHYGSFSLPERQLYKQGAEYEKLDIDGDFVKWLAEKMRAVCRL